MIRRRGNPKVYFIKPIGMAGPIKIGCSQSPDIRRSSLETWSPFPLEIIAELGGNEVLERRFHTKFAASRRTREWFDVSAALLTAIEQIQAGTFDIESLPPPARLKSTAGRKPWSEGAKLAASYSRRIDAAGKAAGISFTCKPSPSELCRNVRNDVDAGAAISLLDAMIAEPVKYGVDQAKWQAVNARNWEARQLHYQKAQTERFELEARLKKESEEIAATHAPATPQPEQARAA